MTATFAVGFTFTLVLVLAGGVVIGMALAVFLQPDRFTLVDANGREIGLSGFDPCDRFDPVAPEPPVRAVELVAPVEPVAPGGTGGTPATGGTPGPVERHGDPEREVTQALAGRDSTRLIDLCPHLWSASTPCCVANAFRFDSPPKHERVETGVVEFPDDWPGIFIRGDRALSYALLLRQAAHVIDGQEGARLRVLWGGVAALADLLHQCDARHKPDAVKVARREP